MGTCCSKESIQRSSNKSNSSTERQTDGQFRIRTSAQSATYDNNDNNLSQATATANATTVVAPSSSCATQTETTTHQEPQQQANNNQLNYNQQQQYHQRQQDGLALLVALRRSKLLSFIINKVRSCTTATTTTNNSTTNNRRSARKNNKVVTLQNYADRLVLETLDSIRPPVVAEPSNAMQKLQMISASETGWLVVINSLINNVDDDNPFGTALISLSIEEACLASRETITKLHDLIDTPSDQWLPTLHNNNNNNYNRFENKYQRCILRQRNICIVLGCLAEKLAGPLSVALLTDQLCNYLLSCIHPENEAIVILYALIALEKFALTQDNKVNICNRLRELTIANANSLLELEHWQMQQHEQQQQQQENVENLSYLDELIFDNNNCLVNNSSSNRQQPNNTNRQQQQRQQRNSSSSSSYEQQVGFVAKYCLDNCFLVDGRPFSFEQLNVHCTNKSQIRAFLNPKDASENLKISANCLSCRNDSSKFESVRANVAVSSGVYYFEATLATSGVMQIGFATKASKFLNHDGYGVGDDDQSLAYDGCRSLIWFNTRSIRTGLPRWKPNDVVGCLINLNSFYIRFSLNGRWSEPVCSLFAHHQNQLQQAQLSSGQINYYAAVSLMPFQQVSVNFGNQPFKYPPSEHSFATFNNAHAHSLLDSQMQACVPKHLLLADSFDLRAAELTASDACTLCCDEPIGVALLPCEHGGFCKPCADKLAACPLCRSPIVAYSTVCSSNCSPVDSLSLKFNQSTTITTTTTSTTTTLPSTIKSTATLTKSCDIN